jgi:hypothetical protein
MIKANINLEQSVNKEYKLRDGPTGIYRWGDNSYFIKQGDKWSVLFFISGDGEISFAEEYWDYKARFLSENIEINIVVK